MIERLDITRPLKTLGGDEVRGVHELPQPWSGGKPYVLGGSVKNDDGSWSFETWTASGQYYADESTSDNDLIYADEPEPEAKPDDMAAILDRLHQIEQRLAGVVGDVDELWVSMRQNTGGKGKGKGCPFARLDAWRAGGVRRSWVVSRLDDGELSARSWVGNCMTGRASAETAAQAAEALCTELGI